MMGRFNDQISQTCNSNRSKKILTLILMIIIWQYVLRFNNLQNSSLPNVYIECCYGHVIAK